MRNKFQKSPPVNSILRASHILQALGDGMENLTDISKALSLNKTTTYRLLKTLETSGFVVQDPLTKRYYLGHLIVRLASSPTISHQRLIVYAFDDMKYLRELSGESVSLQVKVGAQRMVLEELPSNHNIRFTLGRGFVAPLHIGAAGKVLLSELPERELQMILNGTNLVTARTNKGIVSHIHWSIAFSIALGSTVSGISNPMIRVTSIAGNIA